MITKIFGENCKRIKVIDVLLSHPHSKYTKTDLSEISEIHRTTLNTFIDDLIEFGIIEQIKSRGNGYLYKINLNSPITQALNSFQNQLADIEIEKQLIEYEDAYNTKIEIKKPFEEIAKRKHLTLQPSDISLWSTTLEKTNDTLGKLTELISKCDRVLCNLERTNHERSLSFSMENSMQQNQILLSSY